MAQKKLPDTKQVWGILHLPEGNIIYEDVEYYRMWKFVNETFVYAMDKENPGLYQYAIQSNEEDVKKLAESHGTLLDKGEFEIIPIQMWYDKNGNPTKYEILKDVPVPPNNGLIV